MRSGHGLGCTWLQCGQIHVLGPWARGFGIDSNRTRPSQVGQGSSRLVSSGTKFVPQLRQNDGLVGM
jgi:hypothetical protein